jgi:serine/threonine protein kinase
VIKGKIMYMSPEQALNQRLDHRSDLFSAGCVLYEALINEPAFKARNEIDLIFMVRDVCVTPPRQKIPAIPKDLEKAVLKSMARDRGSRFQSAAEFRQALLTYLRNRGAGDWRSELARFMQALCSEDISRENRTLASYDVDAGSLDLDLGENLIADVLGEHAAYASFDPSPTPGHPVPSASAAHKTATKPLRREPGDHQEDEKTTPWSHSGRDEERRSSSPIVMDVLMATGTPSTVAAKSRFSRYLDEARSLPFLHDETTAGAGETTGVATERDVGLPSELDDTTSVDNSLEAKTLENAPTELAPSPLPPARTRPQWSPVRRDRK